MFRVFCKLCLVFWEKPHEKPRKNKGSFSIQIFVFFSQLIEVKMYLKQQWHLNFYYKQKQQQHKKYFTNNFPVSHENSVYFYFAQVGPAKERRSSLFIVDNNHNDFVSNVSNVKLIRLKQVYYTWMRAHDA